ncbi:MAG: O-antigen ligase family protein [Bryobacteraceae bacterium]
MKPPPRPTPAQLAPATDPFRKVGFLILLGYLFILYSRVFDLFLAGLRIPAIGFVLAFGATLLTGGLFRIFSSRIGLALIAFTVWMFVTIPFSVWRGGSFTLATQSWTKAFLVFAMITALTYSIDQCRRAIYMIGWAVTVLAIICMIYGNMSTGRLFLPQGKFENPNDLAQIFLIGLPFLYLMIVNRQTVLHSIAPVCASLLVFYVMSKTGSRGAFLAFLAIVLVLFLRASVTGKMLVAVASLAVFLVATLTLPDMLRKRYFSIFEELSEEDGPAPLLPSTTFMYNSAQASKVARQKILYQSVIMTLKHPIFGVGVGMFPVAQAEESNRIKERPHWLVTHNAYTQVSSEIGIPGFLIYMAVIWYCFREISTVYRRCSTRDGPRWTLAVNMAVCLRISIIGYCVTALFSSVAFQMLLPVLAGVTLALSRAVEAEWAFDAPVTKPSEKMLPASALPRPGMPALQPAPAGAAPQPSTALARWLALQKTPGS